MKNFFSEIDNVTLTFSDFYTADNGIKSIKIYFERPCDKHFFDFLESKIPGFEVVDSLGFDEHEQINLLNYAMKNSVFMWDTAHKNAGELYIKNRTSAPLDNFFSEFKDVTLTFSDILTNSHKDFEYVKLRLERPHKDGRIDYIDSQIPGFTDLDSEGFTYEEIQYWLDYATKSAFLIWDIARQKKGTWDIA